MEIDLDVIRTRNLLIWSQTRNRCATNSWRYSSRTVERLGCFSFQYSFFLLLNVPIFPWIVTVLLETNKILIKLAGLFLNFLKKNNTNSNVSGYWLRRDSNTEPSDLESDALPLRHELLEIFEPYGWKIGFFFLPVFIFSSFSCVYFSLNWHSFTWNQKNPDQVNRPFP